MNEGPDSPATGMQVQPWYRRWFRVAVEFVVVGVCTLAFAFTAMSIFTALLGRMAPGSHDFVAYWASGELLVHHANPYDGSAILQLERSAGYPSDVDVLIMRNPPTALPLTFPLGFLGSRSAQLLWAVLLVACLIASVRLVWRIHGAPKTHLNLLGFSFAPALGCVAAGQSSLFVLFGLALFLRFHRSRPLLAGASLWFCALKPHLFVPFGLVLLGWVIVSRSYRVLTGAAVTLGISGASVMALDPLVWKHYARMIASDHVSTTVMPSLSVVLRGWIGPNTAWLQFLPAGLGCAWALFYFQRHRGNWDWMEHGSPLILVSVLVAPYIWTTDQAILIPALLHGVYLTRSRVLLAVLALASAAIEIAPLRGMPILHSSFYLWTAPAWLAWYLVAVHGKREAEVPGSSVTPVPQGA